MGLGLYRQRACSGWTIITVAVRWYLRYGLSYRDVEELLAERGVEADHVTVYRWVQRFSPLLAEAARFCRRSPGDRWFVDETYVKVNGVWRYVYRAVDQYGQVIDVLVSVRRDAAAARRFFHRALATLKVTPTAVVTDAAAVYPAELDELIPSAWHHVERYANNRIEADHSQLKHRLRPMRGLRTDRTAGVVIAGHASMQNLRRGHYEIGPEIPPCGWQRRLPNSPEHSDRITPTTSSACRQPFTTQRGHIRFSGSARLWRSRHPLPPGAPLTRRPRPPRIAWRSAGSRCRTWRSPLPAGLRRELLWSESERRHR